MLNNLFSDVYRCDGKTAIWEITDFCNLNCIHCYHERGESVRISIESAEQTLKKLKTLGTTHIHFLGGEPLMVPNIIDILALAKKLGFMTTINTNGTRIDDNFAQELLKTKVDFIMISMDGASKEVNDSIRGKGVYEKVLNAINCLHRYEITYGITITISEINAMEIGDVIGFCIKKKIPILRIVLAYQYGNFKLNGLKRNDYRFFDELELAIKKYRSNLLREELKIVTDFRLLPTEYINRKYGKVLQSDMAGLECHPGRDYFILASNLTVYSCLAGKELSEGIAENLDYNLDTENIASSLAVNKEYHKKFLSNYYAVCRDCNYLHLYCEPCPLYSNEDLLQCNWAKQKLHSFLTTVTEKRFLLNNGIMICNNNLVNQEGKVLYYGNQMLVAIIREMETSKVTLGNVINENFWPALDKKQITEIEDAFQYMFSLGLIASSDK